MKLTKIMDGRWLFEIAGHAIPLEQYQVDELAELTAFRHAVTGVVPTGSGVGLRLVSDNEDAPVIHLCYSDEATSIAQAVLDAAKLPDLAVVYFP